MATINSILSGYSLSRGLIPSVGQPVVDKGPLPKTESQDTFVRGQERHNKAQASTQNSASVFAKANKAYGLPFPVARSQESGEPENVNVSGIEKDDPEQVEGQQVTLVAEAEEDNGKTSPNSYAETLSEEEKQQVARLKAVDSEVKAHEMAHLVAAGGYARSGATFQYQQGPDGKKYAVGGEVSIDIGREFSPEKTIEKMRVVRGAALAPANPSSQDQRVAAQATLHIAEAAQELRLEGENGENTIEKVVGKATGGAGEEGNSATVSFPEEQNEINRLSVGLGASATSKSFSSSLYPSPGTRSNDAAVDLFV